MLQQLVIGVSEAHTDCTIVNPDIYFTRNNWTIIHWSKYWDDLMRFRVRRGGGSWWAVARVSVYYSVRPSCGVVSRSSFATLYGLFLDATSCNAKQLREVLNSYLHSTPLSPSQTDRWIVLKFLLRWWFAHRWPSQVFHSLHNSYWRCPLNHHHHHRLLLRDLILSIHCYRNLIIVHFQDTLHAA